MEGKRTKRRLETSERNQQTLKIKTETETGSIDREETNEKVKVYILEDALEQLLTGS